MRWRKANIEVAKITRRRERERDTRERNVWEVGRYGEREVRERKNVCEIGRYGEREREVN